MNDTSIPPINFDGPWKDALTQMLEEALNLFAPQMAADINWSRGYKTLDSELQKVAPESLFGTLAADKVFEVTLHDGADILLSLHIEVQSQRDPEFAKRMFIYNSLLFIRYNREVWALAILGDESPSWQPRRFVQGRNGTRSGIVYPVIKLLKYDMAALDANPNPIVAVILAHRAAQLTRHNMEMRAAVRVDFARRLYRLGYDQATVEELDRLVEWLLWLPPTLKEQAGQNIETIRKEYKMPFVTYGETKAEAKGEAKGKLDAAQAIITRILERKFGTVPAEIEAKIGALSDSQPLEALATDVALAQDLAEIEALLTQA